jgi:hypothetical protein
VDAVALCDDWRRWRLVRFHVAPYTWVCCCVTCAAVLCPQACYARLQFLSDLCIAHCACNAGLNSCHSCDTKTLASVHDAATFLTDSSSNSAQHVMPCHAMTCCVTSCAYHAVWMQVWQRWRCQLCECVWQHVLQPLLCVPWKAGPQLCKVHLGSNIARGAPLISFVVTKYHVQHACGMHMHAATAAALMLDWQVAEHLLQVNIIVGLHLPAPDASCCASGLLNTLARHLIAVVYATDNFSAVACGRHSLCCCLRQTFTLLLLTPVLLQYCSDPVTDWACTGSAA